MTSSLMATPGLGYTCYNGGDNGCVRREAANLKKPSQFGLHFLPLGVHEGGIASNRRSSMPVGIRCPGPCARHARRTRGELALPESRRFANRKEARRPR